MNTLQQSSMFSRRNGSGIRIIFFVAVGALFLYGIYMYHDLHTRLKRTEDRADKFRQQHDSISAQLQVVYEHKSRLEKSLQHERSEHRKTREDLLAKKAEAESKHTNEKTELLNRIESINQQHKMLKSQHEDLQSEFSKVRNQMSKQGEDHKRVINQHNVEYMQLKQEKENEIASLKDQIANLQRKKLDLQSQVEKSRQMDQLNQAQLRQQNQQLQQSLQQQQGGLQQAGNHHQQLQEFIPQHQVVPQGGQPAGVGNYPQGAAYQNQQPIGAQQNLKQQQQGAVGQSQLRGGLQQGVQQGGRQYNLQGGGLHGEPAGPVGLAGHPGQAQQQLHNINMQMAKPGKHLLPKQGHSPEHSPGQGNGEEQPLRKQVLPPRLAPEHKHGYRKTTTTTTGPPHNPKEPKVHMVVPAPVRHPHAGQKHKTFSKGLVPLSEKAKRAIFSGKSVRRGMAGSTTTKSIAKEKRILNVLAGVRGKGKIGLDLLQEAQKQIDSPLEGKEKPHRKSGGREEQVNAQLARPVPNDPGKEEDQ